MYEVQSVLSVECAYSICSLPVVSPVCKQMTVDAFIGVVSMQFLLSVDLMSVGVFSRRSLPAVSPVCSRWLWICFVGVVSVQFLLSVYLMSVGVFSRCVVSLQSLLSADWVPVDAFNRCSFHAAYPVCRFDGR